MRGCKLIHRNTARFSQPPQNQIINHKKWQNGDHEIMPYPRILPKNKRIFEYEHQKNTRSPKNLGIIFSEHALSPVELHTGKSFSNTLQVG
jgi:hypothetical protein